MDIKNVLDAISSFIMDPSHSSRTPLVKGIAWATTIITAVGTIGIAQGLSVIWRKLRHIEKNDTQAMIGQLFRKVFSNNHADHPKNTGEELIQPKEKEPIQQVSPTSIHQKPSIQALSQEVYQNREQLWEAARKDTNGDAKKTMVNFIQKIRDEFKKSQHSLSEVSDDSKALEVLFQDRRLRIALVNYAKVNRLDKLLNQHLVYLAGKIYKKMEDYTNQAVNGAPDNVSEQLCYLTIMIRELFKTEGRSLAEVFSNQEAMNIFQQSNRLMLVLAIYHKMKTTSKAEPSTEKRQEDDERQQVKEAVALGKEHAPGVGLVTRLGLKEFQSDEQQLKKGIHKFLLTNHPDKNPEADPELVKAATQLLEMLKQGVYGQYNETLVKYRKKNAGGGKA